MTAILQTSESPATVGAVPGRGSTNPAKDMDMNMKTHTTAPAGAPDTRTLDALKDLESPICDLGYMAEIFSDMLEESLVEIDFQTGEMTGRPRKGEFLTVRLTLGEIEKLIFASNDVCSRAKAVKTQFYAALEVAA